MYNTLLSKLVFNNQLITWQNEPHSMTGILYQNEENMAKFSCSHLLRLFAHSWKKDKCKQILKCQSGLCDSFYHMTSRLLKTSSLTPPDFVLWWGGEMSSSGAQCPHMDTQFHLLTHKYQISEILPSFTQIFLHLFSLGHQITFGTWAPTWKNNDILGVNPQKWRVCTSLVHWNEHSNC